VCARALLHLLTHACAPRNPYQFLSSCRGLCTILRSEAGGQTDLEEPTAHANATDNRAYKNNAHWLSSAAADGGDDEGQPSNFVAYYDAASLYPTSGE